MYSGDPFSRIDMEKLTKDLYESRQLNDIQSKEIEQLKKENERLKANYLFIVGKSITIADHYLSIMGKIGGSQEE